MKCAVWSPKLPHFPPCRLLHRVPAHLQICSAHVPVVACDYRLHQSDEGSVGLQVQSALSGICTGFKMLVTGSRAQVSHQPPFSLNASFLRTTVIRVCQLVWHVCLRFLCISFSGVFLTSE